MAEVLVQDVMIRDPFVIDREATVREAAEKMLQLEIGALPVCGSQRLLGMVTDRDITIRATSQGKGPETPVWQIMTPNPAYCFEDQPLAEAARVMLKRQVRRLPVLSRDLTIVGMLDGRRQGAGGAGK